jgi:hypothetical protein
MIKHITSNSANLMSSSYIPPYVNNNGQSAGQVRFNTSTQNMEVYDGNMWIAISQNVSMGLSYGAEEAIRWAHERMTMEATAKEMAEKHKAVAAALENLNKAQEQLKTTIILSKEEQ